MNIPQTINNLRTNFRGKLKRKGFAVEPRKITTVYESLFSVPVVCPINITLI